MTASFTCELRAEHLELVGARGQLARALGELGLELGHAGALGACIVELHACLGQRRAGLLGELRAPAAPARSAARGRRLGGAVRLLQLAAQRLCSRPRLLELAACRGQRVAHAAQLDRLLLEPVLGIARGGKRFRCGRGLRVALDQLRLQRGHALLGGTGQLCAVAHRAELALQLGGAQPRCIRLLSRPGEIADHGRGGRLALLELRFRRLDPLLRPCELGRRGGCCSGCLLGLLGDTDLELGDARLGRIGCGRARTRRGQLPLEILEQRACLVSLRLGGLECRGDRGGLTLLLTSRAISARASASSSPTASADASRPASSSSSSEMRPAASAEASTCERASRGSPVPARARHRAARLRSEHLELAANSSARAAARATMRPARSAHSAPPHRAPGARPAGISSRDWHNSLSRCAACARSSCAAASCACSGASSSSGSGAADAAASSAPSRSISCLSSPSRCSPRLSSASARACSSRARSVACCSSARATASSARTGASSSSASGPAAAASSVARRSISAFSSLSSSARPPSSSAARAAARRASACAASSSARRAVSSSAPAAPAEPPRRAARSPA